MGRWLRCDGNFCLYYRYILHVQGNFHISEDSVFHSHHCGNLKFLFIFWFIIHTSINLLLLSGSQIFYWFILKDFTFQFLLVFVAVVRRRTTYKMCLCWSLSSCFQRLGLMVRPGLNITVTKSLWLASFVHLAPGWYSLTACTCLGLFILENVVSIYFCIYWFFSADFVVKFFQNIMIPCVVKIKISR
jgi:hypothetical protein